jgi:hypothetical protein
MPQLNKHLSHTAGKSMRGNLLSTNMKRNCSLYADNNELSRAQRY